MNLTPELSNLGFSLCDVSVFDLPDYINVKRACYKKYVDEYFGGWDEDIQAKMNTDAFYGMMKETCFKKLVSDDKVAGFFAYDQQEDRIGGISVQMLETAQNKGIGTFYLKHITSISDKTNKPIFLKVFKSNPAQNLYKRFGFEIYGETTTHYLMKYNPR